MTSGQLRRALVVDLKGRFGRALADNELNDLLHAKPRKAMADESSARISVDPNLHVGKPCVAGTRVPVRNVLELLQAGCSFAAITTDYYPDLGETDIQACVQYAIDTIDAGHVHLTSSSS